MTGLEVELWLRRWGLTPDGPARSSPTSTVLPVRFDGRPAILKLATLDEERRGGKLMAWWDGEGAAPVLACEGDALLLARAEGIGDLATMSRSGADDEACRILCSVIARLHAPRLHPAPELVPLEVWFRDLREVGAREGGILRRCAEAAADLLAMPREVVPLHGDIHHGNVVDFGDLGWLAIDPKSLIGERGFDYANIFINPDAEHSEPAVAVDPGPPETAGHRRGRGVARSRSAPTVGSRLDRAVGGLVDL